MPKHVLATKKAATAKSLAALKAELGQCDPRAFERLAAALLSRLLDVPVYVAKTGFQFGADAGTAGSGGRRLRIECKRYADTTALNARDLKGGLLEAASSDPSLEAWIVGSTRAVNETDRAGLTQAGELLGISVVFIDWTPLNGGTPPLAVLCAAWPSIVEQFVGPRVRAAAEAVGRRGASALKRLRDELTTWSVGVDSIVKLSHERLSSMWKDIGQSKAYLNQAAAGGAAKDFLRRQHAFELMDSWQAESAQDKPAAVIGLEGTGKTWAVLDWLQANLQKLPIVVALPSSAFGASTDATPHGVRELLARTLHALASSFDVRYWQRRVDRLLLRPADAGPVFYILVDGLNQRPEFPWDRLAMALNSADLAGRVRLILTCRSSYFRQDLRGLRSAVGAVEIPVEPYDTDELSQMLAMHGKRPDDFHPDLLRLAATPRLFPLVMRLADCSALKAEATVHRLLWEYARDVMHSRMDAAFDEQGWGRWLASQAEAVRHQLESNAARAPSVDVRQLAESFTGADAQASDVRRRLSEIVDSDHWMEVRAEQVRRYRLKPAVVTLALGLALLYELRLNEADGTDAVRMALETWLEPIRAIDETVQIVRAALSIAWAEGRGDSTSVVDELLVIWVQSQNPSSSRAVDLEVLGRAFPRSLMTVIERSPGSARTQARLDAARLLRGLPLERHENWQTIRQRMIAWCSRVDCPTPENIAKGAEHYAARQADQLQNRIGVSIPCTRRVMGLEVTLRHEEFGDPAEVIPTILEGHRVADFPQLFAAAAVSLAINRRNGSGWEGLKWLLAAGCDDRPGAISMIRGLSLAARSVATEDYVLPALRYRVAALLLWLVGEEQDDIEAMKVDPNIDGRRSYADDYLASPARSMFGLERRHASSALADRSVSLQWRLGKATDALADPSLVVSTDLIAEVTAAAEATSIEKMDTGRQRTAEEHSLDDSGGAMARVAPGALCALMRRRIRRMTKVDARHKYDVVLRARELMLLVDKRAAEAFGALRRSGPTATEREDAIANTWLMELELTHLSGMEQLNRLGDARLEHLTLQLIDGLAPVSSDDLYRFVTEHPDASGQRARLCLSYLASRDQKIGRRLFNALMGNIDNASEQVRVAAFVGLARAAPEELGRQLFSKGWRPSMDAVVEAHYGATALICATGHVPFSQVIDRIAPWRLLEAAAARGAGSDVVAAVDAVTIAIGSDEQEVEELAGQVTLHSKDSDGFARYSVTERPSQRELREELAATREVVQARHDSVTNHTQATIEVLRRGGAKLYLFPVGVDGLRAAWKFAQSRVRRWLSGMDAESIQFRRRLLRAEGLFLALCEVLLDEEPATGVALWRHLRRHGRTRFKGRGGVSELVHLVFRAQPSPELLGLRDELIALTPTLCDKDLLDVAIAAISNGRVEWVLQRASEDEVAPEPSRRKRAIVLRALCAPADIRHLTWPEGETIGRWQALSRRMLLWRNRDAFARHWWARFLTARNVDDAYAAWRIFLTCADRRALTWMFALGQRKAKPTKLDLLKERHFRANESELEKAMRKREEDSPKFSDKLFGEDMPGTWLSLDGFVAHATPDMS